MVLIMALALGALVPLVGNSLEEEGLRGSARDLEQLARSAHSSAITTGVPALLTISPQSVQVQSVAEEPPKPLSIPKGTSLKIMRWGESKWRAPDNDAWVFQPGGLVEPVQFRLQRDNAWIELGFDPVTGESGQMNFYFP